MISHMRRAGSKCSLTADEKMSYEDFRIGEMKLCEFFDWNISMMTFWDYLEQFLALGFLFEDDFVLLNDEEQLVYEAILDPESSVRENMEMMSFNTPEPEESQVLTFDSVKNRQADDRRKKQRLEKIKASKMIEEHRNRVIDCILNRSLDLAKQVGKRFLTDTHVQREIAY